MSEPLHNRPVPRAKLERALKRNMARRKAAATKSFTTADSDLRSRDGRGEPERVSANEGEQRGGRKSPFAGGDSA